MKRIYSLLLATGIVLSIGNVKVMGQDPYFSQYYNSPFLTNPSMLSLKPDMAVGVQYRNQWQGFGTPFNTFALQGYYPILSKDKFRQFGSAGLMVLNDSKPSSGIKQTGVAVAGAYKLPVNYANYFHFGIQLSYYQVTLGSSNYTTSSQWDGASFNPALSNNETIGTSKGVPAVGLGTTWVNEDAEGDTRGTIGISVFNINKPNVSFYTNATDNLYRRLVATAGIRAVKVDNITVFPTLRYQLQGPNSYFQFGSLFRYGVNQGRNQGEGFIKAGTIGFGLFYQLNQAIIGAVEFQQPNYIISVSYDFGLANMQDGSQRANAPEIFLTFKKNLGRKKKADKRYFKTKDGEIPTGEGGTANPTTGEQPAQPATPVTPTPTPTPPPTPTPAPAQAPTPQVQPAPAPTPAAKPVVAPVSKPAVKATSKSKTTVKGKKGKGNKIRTKANNGSKKSKGRKGKGRKK